MNVIAREVYSSKCHVCPDVRVSRLQEPKLAAFQVELTFGESLQMALFACVLFALGAVLAYFNGWLLYATFASAMSSASMFIAAYLVARRKRGRKKSLH